MGLLAAIFWGGTDFLVGLNARLLGVKRAVFFGQLIGFLVMTLVVLCFFESMAGAAAASYSDWLSAGLTAIMITSGALALSKAFALGKASIIAPVVTCYGIVTTVLSWMSGESISAFQFAGILVCAVGVRLAGVQRGGDNGERRTNNAAVLHALLAAILYGVGFWLHGHYALPVFGPVAMLWLCYAVGLLVLACVVINIKIDLVVPSRQHGSALICASVLNLAGFFCICYRRRFRVGLNCHRDQYLVGWRGGDSGRVVFQGAVDAFSGHRCSPCSVRRDDFARSSLIRF